MTLTRGEWRNYALFAVTCVVWGSTWIAMKFGIATVPPVFLAGTRFTAAGLALAVFLLLRGGGIRVAREDLARFAAVTALMIVATYALLFWGARFVSSGLASILDMAFMPMALLTIGALLGEDVFSRARAAGVAIGVVGLCILFGPKAFAAGGPSGAAELWGAGAIILCAVAYSFGSVLSRPLLRRYSPVLVSGVTTLAEGVVLLAGSLLLEPGAVAALAGRGGWTAWAGWGFLVLFGSLIGYTIFLTLVRSWGASRAGSYAFVSPVIAVLLGVWVFGETVTALDAAGMATMLAGAFLTLRPA